LGWSVLRIWQHELHEPAKVARRVSKLLFRYSATLKGRKERSQTNRDH
jgi:very-short-patch-repair endonuclease